MNRRSVMMSVFISGLAVVGIIFCFTWSRVDVRSNQLAGPNSSVKLMNGIRLPDGATNILIAEETARDVFGRTELQIDARFSIDEPGFREWAAENQWSAEKMPGTGAVEIFPVVRSAGPPLPGAKFPKALICSNQSRGARNSYVAVYDPAQQRVYYQFQSRPLQEN